MKKSNLIRYLAIIGFFAIFSTTISKNPVLPLFAQSLGAKESIIGTIAALSPFAGILFGLPVGILADKLGRKKMLNISGLIFVTAPLMYIFVNNPYYLIPIRFFHGLATAILGPVASTIIAETYAKNRGLMLGTYNSATLFGRTLAPLLGGIIISYFSYLSSGWNYKLVYLVAFIISLISFIIIFSLKYENSNVIKKKSKLKFKEFFTSAKIVLKDKIIITTGLVQMTVYFSFGAFETYLPLYLNSINFPAYMIGIIFSLQTISIALTQPFFGKLADRINPKKQIIIGLLLVGLSISSITLFTRTYLIIISSLLFGLGMAITTIATSVYTAKVAKKKSLGSSLGALSSIMDIGHTLGPVIIGIIIGATSFNIGFLSCLLLAIIIETIFIIVNFKNLN